MRLEFEYGHGTMGAELPDTTDVFIPGETVADPDHIPEDQLKDAYLESLAHPIGMPRLLELAHKGSTVTIIVPDRVKGGELFADRKKKSITRATFEQAYQKIIEDTEHKIISPKSLNCFGAPYVWAVFKALGVV